jgi:hypothetical protein
MLISAFVLRNKTIFPIRLVWQVRRGTLITEMLIKTCFLSSTVEPCRWIEEGDQENAMVFFSHLHRNSDVQRQPSLRAPLLYWWWYGRGRVMVIFLGDELQQQVLQWFVGSPTAKDFFSTAQGNSKRQPGGTSFFFSRSGWTQQPSMYFIGQRGLRGGRLRCAKGDALCICRDVHLPSWSRVHVGSSLALSGSWRAAKRAEFVRASARREKRKKKKKQTRGREEACRYAHVREKDHMQISLFIFFYILLLYIISLSLLSLLYLKHQFQRSSYVIFLKKVFIFFSNQLSVKY